MPQPLQHRSRFLPVIPSPHKNSRAYRPEQREEEYHADDPDLQRGQSDKRNLGHQRFEHSASIDRSGLARNGNYRRNGVNMSMTSHGA